MKLERLVACLMGQSSQENQDKLTLSPGLGVAYP